jgi:hypothetical protein
VPQNSQEEEKGEAMEVEGITLTSSIALVRLTDRIVPFPANLSTDLDRSDWLLVEVFLQECGSLPVLCTHLAISNQDEMSEEFKNEFKDTPFTKKTTKAKLWNNIRNLRFKPAQGILPYPILSYPILS